ncbi:hypothetical protein [Streptomyces violaceusniger]|uniref:Uncharacterized protein n=1 Tax=Streptomyces violaceusniger (strain Tu 4113) TaxID=653045 RepID=G2P7A0_STRV4|nr:hypothetical protein [Streptomyces violaceusniger]AEM87060.1 hypothetical protein Strvi_7725 [Streptomyces violaceusniger Tu 4113]
MTENEIRWLALGFTLGLYVMLAAQILGGMLDDRRDRKALRAAETRYALVRTPGGDQHE